MSYPNQGGPWNTTPVIPAAYAPRVAVSDVHLALAWIGTVFTLGYLLPWAVAATRRKSNSAAIGLLTFFAGWTAVGWLVALVMACMAEPVRGVYVGLPAAYPPVAAMSTPPGWYPDGTGGTRYWDGTQWSAV